MFATCSVRLTSGSGSGGQAVARAGLVRNEPLQQLPGSPWGSGLAWGVHLVSRQTAAKADDCLTGKGNSGLAMSEPACALRVAGLGSERRT